MRTEARSGLYRVLCFVVIMMTIIICPAKVHAADHYLLPYQTEGMAVYSGSLDKSFSMMGKSYTYGAAPSNYTGYHNVLLNLDKQFSQVTFEVGALDNKKDKRSATLYIYFDNDTTPAAFNVGGASVNSAELTYGMITKRITVNTTGKSSMRIETKGSNSMSIWYAIGNVIGYGGHVFETQNVTKMPTVSATGIMTEVCSVCGVTRSITIPAEASCNPFLSESILYKVSDYSVLRDKGDKFFTVMGRKQLLGVYPSNSPSSREVLFNLGGAYKTVSFKVGHLDGKSRENGYLNIYLDDPNRTLAPYATIELTGDMLSKEITVPVSGVTQLLIRQDRTNINSTWYALYDFHGVQTGRVAHKFDKQETLPATQTSTGICTITCNVCGLTYTETIPKIETKPNAGTADTGSTDEISISDADVKLSATKMTYSGTACEPEVQITLDGTTLKNGTDYKVTYSDNIEAGTALVEITGCGKYTGYVSRSFEIVKPSQKIKVAAKKMLKSKKLAQKSQSFRIEASSTAGTLSFKKVSGSKKISINKKGLVKVKKGLKKGTYKLKVKVTAAATKKYAATSVTKTIRIVVK